MKQCKDASSLVMHWLVVVAYFFLTNWNRASFQYRYRLVQYSTRCTGGTIGYLKYTEQHWGFCISGVLSCLRHFRWKGKYTPVRQRIFTSPASNKMENTYVHRSTRVHIPIHSTYGCKLLVDTALAEDYYTVERTTIPFTWYG